MYKLLGNPNLNPKTTISYELTVAHQFGDNYITNLTAFYKDIFDYPTSKPITVEGIQSYDNGEQVSGTLYMYFNQDYARSRGLELGMRKVHSDNWSGNLSLGYTRTSGKSSRTDEALLVGANIMQEKSLGEQPVSWDRPFNGTISLTYRVDKDNPPTLMGITLPIIISLF